MASSSKTCQCYQSNDRDGLISWRSTSTLLMFSFLLGLAGIIFGSIAVSRHSKYQLSCSQSLPRLASVSWEKQGSAGSGKLLIGGDKAEGPTGRRKVLAVVGIHTEIDSVARRNALRKTWFPSDRAAHQRVEESTGLVFRFVIGSIRYQANMSELEREIAEHDDFLQVKYEEYTDLPYKTLAYFKEAYDLFDAEFYVKCEDSIYLRLDRLSLLLAQKRDPRTYLGCMKKGLEAFKYEEPSVYEPHYDKLLGKDIFLHAYGPIYALSADVVATIVNLGKNRLRMFRYEDITVGSWMLAMNVNHEDNRSLCASDCGPSAIAVWDNPSCSGLCYPESELLELHRNLSCSGSPIVPFEV